MTRFSIVCYLDTDSTDKVRAIQYALGTITGARASLELWLPHITVGDGVEVSEEDIPPLQQAFDTLAHSNHPFTVELRDILKVDFRKGGEGEETTPYGLYLDVKKNEPLLALVNKIAQATVAYPKWYRMPSPYHPHCALAFKDLSKEGYDTGITFLDQQDMSITATLDHVSLVEMLPNETREYARFHFSTPDKV